MTYNVLNQYNQYNETIASRCSHGSMNFVAVRCVRRCGLRIAFVAHAQAFRCSAVRSPQRRRIRMPKNFVALQCVRRCGPRIAFVAAECRRISWLCSAYAAVGCILRLSHPNAEEYRLFAAFRCSAVRTPLWAAHCLCRIRMPKDVVALRRVRRYGLRVALLHPYVYRECFPRRFLKHTYIVPELVGHSFIIVNRDSLPTKRMTTIWALQSWKLQKEWLQFELYISLEKG